MKKKTNKSKVKYDGKTILEVQKILGERIDITLKKDLTPEERERENAQTALVLMMAKQMINAGDLTLRTEKLMAQNKQLTGLVVGQMIGIVSPEDAEEEANEEAAI